MDGLAIISAFLSDNVLFIVVKDTNSARKIMCQVLHVSSKMLQL